MDPFLFARRLQTERSWKIAGCVLEATTHYGELSASIIHVTGLVQRERGSHWNGHSGTSR